MGNIETKELKPDALLSTLTIQQFQGMMNATMNPVLERLSVHEAILQEQEDRIDSHESTMSTQKMIIEDLSSQLAKMQLKETKKQLTLGPFPDSSTEKEQISFENEIESLSESFQNAHVKVWSFEKGEWNRKTHTQVCCVEFETEPLRNEAFGMLKEKKVKYSDVELKVKPAKTDFQKKRNWSFDQACKKVEKEYTSGVECDWNQRKIKINGSIVAEQSKFNVFVFVSWSGFLKRWNDSN